MKKIFTLVLPLLFAALSARADVIWQELFQYPDGPIILNSTNNSGGTNWIRYSGTANPPDLIVNNHRLEIATTLSGNPPGSRQDDCGRLFATTAGSSYTNSQQVIYVSFIVNFTNLPASPATYFGNFKYGAATSTSYEGRIFALPGNLTNTFRLGVAVGSTLSQTYPVDLALNSDYQVVLQWDPVNLYAISLWINPITSDDAKVTSGDTFTPTASNIADEFGFRQATGFGGFLTVSNMVVATTFDEAAINVMATNAVRPTFAYQPPAVTTNFQNDAVSLSAIANGQGLSSLTYQWQVSSSPANTSPANVLGGNANVLSVDSSTIGTSYYTLVVTTPYGLSTTSSVAKVAIIAPMGPPSFVTQPVSQLAYSGQAVTLTTTVLSPGNITYTWYSNNVVVTAGQQNSGMSSSYVLSSVTPADSATYKVAVTNDTTANGIVSTNAVLTVSNAPVVTISYLRSLADSNNAYSATPGIPYQVTGTVTTFTNLTSGTTSSYYLQDGTAGINIFITGDATFRPAQGDVVTYVGVLSSYTSGLELYANVANNSNPGYGYTSYTDTGTTAPLPTPINIGYDITTNLNNVNYNIAGSLVKLSDVYFGTNAGVMLTNTTANTTITVTNSSGQKFNLLFFYLDGDTFNQTLPTYAYSVTGVLYGINSTFSLAVTRFADINTTTPPTVTSIAINSVTDSGGNVTLNWAPTPAGSFTYTVWRAPALSGTPNWTQLQTGITTTTYTDTGVSAGTGFYRVSSP